MARKNIVEGTEPNFLDNHENSVVAALPKNQFVAMQSWIL